MKYQIEKVDAIKKELEVLIKNHWEEIALNQDKIKLNPDWDTYRKLENIGMLYLYTARKDKKLAGYFCVVATKGLHYADHILAACDVIYISPEYRKGSAGSKLIKYAEKDLKDKNVSSLSINTKCHAPFDALLERMGYGLIEKTYSKYIGD